MIVIVIVGILAAVALPNFLSQTKKAAATEATQNVSAIFKQATAYTLENGELGTIDKTCAAYAGSQVGNFEYRCTTTAPDGSDFEVWANGDDANKNTKDVCVKIKGNVTTGLVDGVTRDLNAGCGTVSDAAWTNNA